MRAAMAGVVGMGGVLVLVEDHYRRERGRPANAKILKTSHDGRAAHRRRLDRDPGASIRPPGHGDLWYHHTRAIKGTKCSPVRRRYICISLQSDEHKRAGNHPVDRSEQRKTQELGPLPRTSLMMTTPWRQPDESILKRQGSSRSWMKRIRVMCSQAVPWATIPFI